MNNPFDQFDTQNIAGNPFDKFDQPSTMRSSTSWETPAASMVRGIGQSAQAGLEGLGSIYDLARMPFNQVGANIPSATDIIRAHSPFPSPNNIASDLTRGTTSGLASLATGAGLAESGFPLAEKVGQVLTESPASQIGSFAGSEAARGVAQRYGAGPAGQMAAQFIGALPGAMGTGMLDAPMKSLSESTASNPLIKGIASTSPEDLPAIANSMKSSAGSVINQATKNGGVTFNADKTSSIVSDIEDALNSHEFIEKFNPKTSAIVDYIKDKAKNGQLDLSQLTQYRTLLGRVGNTEDGVSAGAVRKVISNAIDTATPADLANGDMKSIELLNQGRTAYAQASRFEDVADIVGKANGDPNRLKAALTRFAADDSNTRGWTLAQKSALEQAKNTGIGENLLKSFGKLGIDFAKSGTGNTVLPYLISAAKAGGASLVPGGIPLVAAATVARQGQKYLARGYAQKLLDTLQ